MGWFRPVNEDLVNDTRVDLQAAGWLRLSQLVFFFFTSAKTVTHLPIIHRKDEQLGEVRDVCPRHGSNLGQRIRIQQR